jgi:hypothetical protein
MATQLTQYMKETDNTDYFRSILSKQRYTDFCHEMLTVGARGLVSASDPTKTERGSSGRKGAEEAVDYRDDLIRHELSKLESSISATSLKMLSFVLIKAMRSSI